MTFIITEKKVDGQTFVFHCGQWRRVNRADYVGSQNLTRLWLEYNYRDECGGIEGYIEYVNGTVEFATCP